MKQKKINSGCVTLPTEAGKEDIVLELAERCGADVLRDSDGTILSDKILDMGFDIYSTVCITRTDQEWSRKHPNHLPQQYLMSHRELSSDVTLTIELLREFCSDKYRINNDDSPKQWWEVFNRTTGGLVSCNEWNYENGSVTIQNTVPYHEYTVNFLVYQTWDSVSMYNHTVNNWTCEKIISVNPFLPDVYQHLIEYFQEWLELHPRTNVVRFTTFAFMFMIINDSTFTQRIVDWTGYAEAVSPVAMLEFERVKGYRLRSEDFVDMGRFNPTSCPPSQRYLDWIDFIHDFVIRFGKDLVDLCHAADKKAAMFWGDHWIGVEPYSPRFQDMGMDIHIGACEHGTDLRRISDVPGDQTKEVRLYPYFFPDVFREGGDPKAESMNNWVKIRRALLRNPIDRIGWGGYLSLAHDFPDFTDHMEALSREFREFIGRTKKTPSYKAPIRVAVLDAWGTNRSWISHTGIDNKFKKSRNDSMVCEGTDILECLAGLPFEVEFISFLEIIDHPSHLNDIDVIINEGDANSSWSGCEYWANPNVLAILRKFVHDGGGFIGIKAPTACDYQGRLFQLPDILGVQKEIGHTLNTKAYNGRIVDNHFLVHDLSQPLSTFFENSFVFACNENVQICEAKGAHIHIAAHDAGEGRSVFLSGLPFSNENARLLHRAVFWVANKEHLLKRCYSSNPATDIAYYPDAACCLLVNNTSVPVTTTIYDHDGEQSEVNLVAFEGRWIG